MPRAALGDYLLELAGDPDAVARFLASADFARSSMARAGLSEAAQGALLSRDFLAINSAIADELRSLAESGVSFAGLSLSPKTGLRAEQQIAVEIETHVQTNVETHVQTHVEEHVLVTPRQP